jgi:hypothetical protein
VGVSVLTKKLVHSAFDRALQSVGTNNNPKKTHLTVGFFFNAAA